MWSKTPHNDPNKCFPARLSVVWEIAYGCKCFTAPSTDRQSLTPFSLNVAALGNVPD